MRFIRSLKEWSENMAGEYRSLKKQHYLNLIKECASSGKSLDVANGGMKSGTNVWQYDYTGDNAQKWIIKESGRIKEKKIVMKSSSGGAFTAISDYFIERGDAVIAAVYEYDNYNLNYKIIQSKSDRE